LEKLIAAPETNGASGVERAVGRIKFDPIGVQFGVPEPNRNVAFGNRGLRILYRCIGGQLERSGSLVLKQLSLALIQPNLPLRATRTSTL
tara:strand:- start:147 stop:416 length:270 start_codon:yes stop_codon:yes gene_type:complete